MEEFKTTSTANTNENIDKKKKKPWKWIGTGVAVAVIVIIAVIFAIRSANTVKLKDYVEVEYTGINGYALASATVDSDGLFKKLSGKTTNTEQLEAYKNLANSVKATATGSGISNGDKVTVTVSYNKDYAEKAGVDFSDVEYEIKASGIGDGEKINLFENVNVIIAGISPDAYIRVENKWTDDYLNRLGFKPDKTSGISNGDVIKITCSASASELAKRGYAIDSLSIDYTVPKISSYAKETADFDMSIIREINVDSKALIDTETSDTTFRMLFKATGNTAYLSMLNDETATNIKLEKCYFLTKKNEAEGQVNNYLYYIYTADVSMGEYTENLAFVFEFENTFITPEGKFDVDRENLKEKYHVGGYDEMYQSYIGSKEDIYKVTEVMGVE